jgi:hypothetical protein
LRAEKQKGGETLKIKVLFLLALTLLAAISTIATVAVTLKRTPVSFSVTKTKAATTDFGHVQPTGDPIDDPVFPS